MKKFLSEFKEALIAAILLVLVFLFTGCDPVDDDYYEDDDRYEEREDDDRFEEDEDDEWEDD